MGASFSMSVWVLQHLMGIDLYWVILPLVVILLLAMGSDSAAAVAVLIGFGEQHSYCLSAEAIPVCPKSSPFQSSGSRVSRASA